MVLRLTDEHWTYRTPEGVSRADVTFASASAAEAGQDPTLTILWDGEPHDRVTLRVPHSWWPASGQPFCPPIGPGDELTVDVSGGTADVRIDLNEHEA